MNARNKQLLESRTTRKYLFRWVGPEAEGDMYLPLLGKRAVLVLYLKYGTGNEVRIYREAKGRWGVWPGKRSLKLN